MSGLTRCNYCTLADMKAEAKDHGVTVIVRVEPDGEFESWTSARYSDKSEPSHYFLELTDHCVC